MLPRRFFTCYFFLLATGLAFLAMLTVDLPVSRWCYEYDNWEKPWREFRKWIMLSEIFGYAWGGVLAVIAVRILDPKVGPRLWNMVLALVAAGLAPGLIKLFVSRLRPRVFFDPEEYTGLRESVWETFAPLEKWFNSSSGMQSFPSGHSAFAFGLAVSLVWLYPRGRYLFYFLAVLAMTQRVVSSSHYVSDTIFGAAIGAIAASLFLPKEKEKAVTDAA